MEWKCVIIHSPPFIRTKPLSPIFLNPSSSSKKTKTHHLKPLLCSLPISHSLHLSTSFQADSLKTLEWGSLCRLLSPFTSTSMGYSATQNADIPIGGILEESLKLLDQTAAALTVLQSGPLDLSGIEDIIGIVNSAASGTLLTVGELCAVRRTLRAAEAALLRLTEDGDCLERYSPLLEILHGCNFQKELEQKIGLCIDCKLSIILDRASEELEFIRAERRNNLENLDTLMKEISTRIFQAGGIDRPLVTKRRSRFCVAVRTSHRYLIPDGVVLNVSSSGATYFMEPGEAVELNNLEVMLSNSEKAEEIAILSLLTSEIAESERDIKHLLNGFLEIDLAFARAAYAQQVNGVCPIFSDCSEGASSSAADGGLSIDIEGIQHPLLLGSSQRSLLNVLGSGSRNSAELHGENDGMDTQSFSAEFPVPINIKVGCGTRVVVVSGPNTGGKTASMKTLGLASIMSKAGLYVTAKNAPRLPWFDFVLADIGDHQSLEHNLSTFSGHISRICKILEVASKESLVLIDEICSGTDPSEGVALATSILEYLKDHVNLAVVTTHYGDLSHLKDKDTRFENAAMQFSVETLQPTYQILWGSTGVSNALSIAKSLGFDVNIIEHAKNWVEKLKPEKQQERKGLIYHSLMEERNRLEAQAREAAFLQAEAVEIYHEIQHEAEDLDQREKVLVVKETQQVKQEIEAADTQIKTVVQDFEDQIRTASPDQYNSLIRKSEMAIASILEAHNPGGTLSATESDAKSYTPKVGEQVHVKGLGGKLATVVEAAGDDETILIQYGKIRVRVKKNDIRAVPSNDRSNVSNLAPRFKRQGWQNRSEVKTDEAVSYGGARVQTSKNTVDLRAMRVEEAALQLDMAISARESHSVIFIVHGMGTGAVKQRALEILRKHPRVARYEPESPMNFGCTVAYIN
uniref:DNA mismatch repair MutS family protein n=1 Tax=Rhizophora mucronata TaxID=61149 RepID=A0A2P2PID9_RHIMU